MIFEVFDQKMSEKNLKNMLGGPGGPPPDLKGLKLQITGAVITDVSRVVKKITGSEIFRI